MDKLRKSVNEMISKTFSFTIRQGFQSFEKTTREAGHDLNDISETGKKRTKEFFESNLPNIIFENLASLKFMMHASTFVNEIRDTDGSEFRGSIFIRLSFFGLFALITYLVPEGPYYVFKLITIILTIYPFYSAIFYVRRKLKTMKSNWENEFNQLTKDYKLLIEK